ncbi:MAG: glycosyltransferase family 2 protein, partial [Aestuariibaculum sp.]
MQLHYSFIVPVYNRPNETEELLQSFSELETTIPFEIVIVEDGST